jgi:hypothetical protein
LALQLGVVGFSRRTSRPHCTLWLACSRGHSTADRALNVMSTTITQGCVIASAVDEPSACSTSRPTPLAARRLVAPGPPDKSRGVSCALPGGALGRRLALGTHTTGHRVVFRPRRQGPQSRCRPHQSQEGGHGSLLPSQPGPVTVCEGQSQTVPSHPDTIGPPGSEQPRTVCCLWTQQGSRACPG